MLASIPEDCIIEILRVVRLHDIARVRRTCKELSRITRARIVWVSIYTRLSRKLTMPPIPSPYTLPTIPSSLLETLCLSAYKLHLKWTSRIPKPTRLKPVAVPQLSVLASALDGANPEPLRLVKLAPGGRWLVAVTSDQNVVMCDLKTGEAKSVVEQQEMMEYCLKEVEVKDTGKGKDHASQSRFQRESLDVSIVWRDHLTASVLCRIAGAIGSSSSIYVLQEWVFTRQPTSYSLQNEQAENTTPISTAHISLRSSHIMKWPKELRPDLSQVDMSAFPLVSFCAPREPNEILVLNSSTGRGIVLEIESTKQVGSIPSVTRILATKEHIYVALIDPSISVQIFVVPPLEGEQEDGGFHRIRAAPIVKDTVSTQGNVLHFVHVSAWVQALSQGSDGSPQHTLHIPTSTCFHTYTFTPTASLSTYSSLAFVDLHIIVGAARLVIDDNDNDPGRLQVVPWSQIAPWEYASDAVSGRGLVLFQETSTVMLPGGERHRQGRQVLKLVADFPPSTSTSTSESDVDDDLPVVPRGLHTVFSGLPMTYTNSRTQGAAVSFDATTGRVCFLKLVKREGAEVAEPEVGVEFLVVDFAEKALLEMY